MYLKNKTGFTLIEVMVASTIGAFISLVAVGTLKAVISSNAMVEENIEIASEMRFAANLIERDLINFYHPANFSDTELIGTYEELAEYNTAIITFYSLNRTKARYSQPEGDMYEVEYYLEKNEDESALIRRVRSNPDPNVATLGIQTIIAENVERFDISYYDGENWYADWPEDMTDFPHLVEVYIEAAPSDKGKPIIETLLVNLMRSVTNSGISSGSSSSTGTSSSSG
jgi:general secretion pathway protein J